MSCSFIHLGNVKGMLFTLVAGCLILMADHSRGQTTLNVTNFGARGDAVQFFANTTSNSTLVTTTNQLSASDVGEVIELFGAGPLGTTNIHQDLLAYIANVVNGTNIYMDRMAGATTNGCTGWYGHNNLTNFQACLDAAPSNSVINVPNGTYFLIPTQALDPSYVESEFVEPQALTIRKGGLTIQGQSEFGTVLLGNGAWQNFGAYVMRGCMFGIVGPITNAGPLTFEDLSMDGGAYPGLTTNYTYWPASTADGSGWDVTHGAIIWSGHGPLNSQTKILNCWIHNWRGEQVKCNVGNWDCAPPGPALLVSNCVFSGGTATALNAPLSHVYEDCTFSNLFEIEEFYQGYTTNQSVMQHCFATNIVGALMACNGALSNSVNPAYTVQSNTFYMTGNENGIETTPVQNLIVSHNNFTGTGGGTALVLGCAGYQGSTINSNIVMAYNTVSNCFYLLLIEGGGNNRVADVQIATNTLYGAGGGSGFATGYGWGTNITFLGNTVYPPVAFALNDATMTGQWFLDDASNQFPPHQQQDNVGQTNVITYAYGMRHQISGSVANSVWVIGGAHPSQVPPGAVLQITSTGKYPVQLYSSVRMSGSPVVLTNGETVNYLWTNSAWVNVGDVAASPPAANASPINIGFGTILSGTSKTGSFTVRNVGGGTLSGTAGVPLPFNIVSGGAYNLGANQSQMVTVSFNPAAAGNYNQNVTLTGGGGATVAVSGSATNAPLPAVIAVTPGSVPFGTVLSGASTTGSFTVKNMGGSTLTGTATVAAPFSIVSGGTYHLGANQSQIVKVAFKPTMAGNYSQNVTLTGGGGTTVAVSGSATNAPPPAAIQVSRTSLPFGTILTNTSRIGSFTVQNVGGSTLNGTASVPAPFNIVSGGNYNLGANQSQTVTVSFNPTSAGNYRQSVTLTGGGGASVGVSGSATNAPILPAVSAIGVDTADVNLSLAGLQIYAGTTVHFSASTTNAQTWQWSYAVNDGAPIVYTNSTSPITNISYSFGTNMAGSNFVWTLTVSNGAASASSMTNLLVEAPPLPATPTTNYVQGPTIPATSGTLSGFLTASTVINGVATTYFYQPLFFIGKTSGGTATYNVTVTNAGNYEIEAWVHAPNADADSFLVNIDGQPESPGMLWDITPYTSGFAQRIVSWRGDGSPGSDQFVPKLFDLSAGRHQIVFVGSQPGAALASFSLVQVITKAQLQVSPPPAPTDLRISLSGP